MTIWTSKLDQQSAWGIIKSRRPKAAIISQSHTCRPEEGEHCHVYVHLQSQQRLSHWGAELLRNHYVSPLEVRGGDTLTTAIEKYVTYLKGKGSNYLSMGNLPEHTGTHTHPGTHYTHPGTHTPARTHTHTGTHKPAHTHTGTHTHTHTLAHTHKHPGTHT